MTTTVEQFLIEIGFDDKDAINGIKKTLEDLDDIAKKQKRRLTEENILLRAQNSLKRKILQAEKEGMNASFYKEILATSEEVETIRERTAELDKEILSKVDQRVKKERESARESEKAKALEAQRLKQHKSWNGIFKESLADMVKTNDGLKKMSSYYKDLERSSSKIQSNDRESLKDKKKDLKIEQQIAKLKGTRRFRDFSSAIGAPESNQFVDKLRQQMQLAAKGDLEAIRRTRQLNEHLQETAVRYRRASKEALGLKTVQRGITDSTRNMIRSYASLFALVAGTGAINRSAQDLESMRASMLLTSEDSKTVGENLKFVEGESKRLGLRLKESSKAFTRFASAARGKVEDEDIRNIFTSIAESATVSQLSVDETTGAFRALVQMMTKGQIMAEEFKNQLAERMPLAARAMEKATGLTSKELAKQIELGNLASAEVLPKFANALREIIAETGALEKSLETSRTAQNRLVTGFELATDTIGTSGFNEGITSLFDSLRENLEESSGGLEGLGKFFNKLFKIIEKALDIIIPVLDVFFVILGKIADNLGFLLTAFIAVFGKNAVTRVVSMITQMKLFGFVVGTATTGMRALAAATAIAFAKFFVMFKIVKELYALFSKNVIGDLEVQLGRDISVGDIFSKTPRLTSAARGFGIGSDFSYPTPQQRMNVTPNNTSEGTKVYIDKAEIKANNPDEFKDWMDNQYSNAFLTP